MKSYCTSRTSVSPVASTNRNFQTIRSALCTLWLLSASVGKCKTMATTCRRPIYGPWVCCCSCWSSVSRPSMVTWLPTWSSPSRRLPLDWETPSGMKISKYSSTYCNKCLIQIQSPALIIYKLSIMIFSSEIWTSLSNWLSKRQVWMPLKSSGIL